MQTFLPFPSFSHSVEVLDRARLGKQRVECGQILTALRMMEAGETNAGWQAHPAVRMWRGHASALGVYMTLCIREWQSRGYNNTMIPPYDADWRPEPLYHWSAGMKKLSDVVVPAWLGDADFHASHRSNLLRKMPEHYGALGWAEAPTMEYVWPAQA